MVFRSCRANAFLHLAVVKPVVEGGGVYLAVHIGGRVLVISIDPTIITYRQRGCAANDLHMCHNVSLHSRSLPLISNSLARSLTYSKLCPLSSMSSSLRERRPVRPSLISRRNVSFAEVS